MGAEIRKELLGQHGHHVDAKAPRMLAVILDRFQQLCLGLLAKSRQLRRFSLLADPLQILQRGDPQLVMECLDLLGPEPLKFEQLENPRGKGTLQLVVVFHAPGCHQFGDLLGDGLADSFDRPQAPFGHQSLDRFAQ